MSDRKMMLGSEGKLDYLIIAQRGATALGIKTFVAGSDKYGLSLSIRIRAALLPSAKHEDKVKFSGGGKEAWKDVWPEIAFERADSSRASNMIMVPTGKMPWQFKDVKAMVPDAADAVCGKILENFPLDELDGIEDAMAFISEGWMETLKNIEDSMVVKPLIEIGSIKASYITDLFNSVTEGSAPPEAVGKFSSQPKKTGHLKLVAGTDIPEGEPDQDEIGTLS